MFRALPPLGCPLLWILIAACSPEAPPGAVIASLNVTPERDASVEESLKKARNIMYHERVKRPETYAMRDVSVLPPSLL